MSKKPASGKNPGNSSGIVQPAHAGSVQLGGGALFVIAGPCVIESEQMTFDTARELKNITSALGVPFVFKSSYDKANRTSAASFRGPGIERGLDILARVRDELGVPVLSDVHSEAEAERAGKVLDILQIPAFLSRQTDLLVAAARTGRCVNVKKGQFMAPGDMGNVVAKLAAAGCTNVLLTDRGASFGYHNLVSDMRAIPIMRGFGRPVVFDATHSVQMPGGEGDRSGGDRRFVPFLSRAAVAAGCDGVFMEVHPDPSVAMSDGPNQVPLAAFRKLLESLVSVRAAVAPFLTGLEAL
ncbi:MAG: 3-deoxy-8-phosphooctulonate synthase [Nitrospirota bacterium]|nr:3-deoxy-8-phosphooctulonate synthase [Nitrospirota bacterium]